MGNSPAFSASPEEKTAAQALTSAWSLLYEEVAKVDLSIALSLKYTMLCSLADTGNSVRRNRESQHFETLWQKVRTRRFYPLNERWY